MRNGILLILLILILLAGGCIINSMDKRMYRHYSDSAGVLRRDMFPLALQHHMRVSGGYSSGYGDNYIKHYAERLNITLAYTEAMTKGIASPTSKVLEDMNLVELYCECGATDEVFYKLRNKQNG